MANFKNMFLVKCRKDVLKLRTGTLHLIKIAANSYRRTRQEAAQRNLFCRGLLWCNYKGMRCVLCGPFSRWNLVVNTLCQTEMKKYKNTKNVGMLHQIYIKTPEGMNENGVGRKDRLRICAEANLSVSSAAKTK